MKSLKEMLGAMSDKAVSKLAVKIWDSYQDDAEDGIARELDVNPKDACKMLDSYISLFCDEYEDNMGTPENLADCLRVYRDGGSRESILKAQLRELKAREAEIKKELKEITQN